MRLLLLPLSGAFFVLFLAILAVKIFALVDGLSRPESAYTSAGKQTKTFWTVVLVLAVLSSVMGFLSLIGLVAALVYVVDVRPALKEVPRGGSGQMGPYGPW